jgi:molecular chaperone DnaJ
VARACGRCRGTGRIITTLCKDCRGQGQIPTERKLQIKIPPGVDTGSQLRITGEGEPGTAGGPPGDLYVVVRAEEHALFRREGATLFCETPISITQAALGATIEVPTVEGGRTRLKVPEGTQDGSTFRLRGQGVPYLGAKGRGDLHVAVRVVVPTRLNAEQRRLLEQLAQTLPAPELSPKDRSFVDKVKDILS